MLKRTIHYGAVLLIIAGISAGILAFANKLTMPAIKKHEIETVALARQKVLAASEFVETEKINVDKFEFIPGKKDGKVIGYVTTVASPGYAGDITFILGMDMNGKITGLNVVSSSETPGLGAKIMDENWQKIWTGRDVQYKFEKSVDAFAGATISPKAVYTGVINALEAFKEVK